jgi:hypothetical protein
VSGEGSGHSRRSDIILEMPVKPSAQPTLVRTQHLPPRKPQVGACFRLAAGSGEGAVCHTACRTGTAAFLQVSGAGCSACGARPGAARRICGEYAEKFLRSPGHAAGSWPGVLQHHRAAVS